MEKKSGKGKRNDGELFFFFGRKTRKQEGREFEDNDLEGRSLGKGT